MGARTEEWLDGWLPVRSGLPVRPMAWCNPGTAQATGSSHRVEGPKVCLCVAHSGLPGRSSPRVPSCC
jgi:hypothetical protein